MRPLITPTLCRRNTMGPQRTAQKILPIQKMSMVHLPEVMAIENQSALCQSNEYNGGVSTTHEKTFMAYIRNHRRYLPAVVQYHTQVISFIVFDILEREIVNLAVHPQARLRSLGTAMLGQLKYELGYAPMKIWVRESNTGGLTFLFKEKNGFRFGAFQRGHYKTEGGVQLWFGQNVLIGKKREPINRLIRFG